MRLSLAVFLSFFAGHEASALAVSKAHYIDYEKLDLTVSVQALRSGNQDPSGTNSYYLRMSVDALPVLKEEIKKSFAERLKVERVVGIFGELEIKSLKYWAPDKKPIPAFSLSLKGDVIREIAAETMRQFTVPEDGVSVICRIELFEKNKKFNFFGEDTKVGESVFPIIPESLPHLPLVENRELNFSDESGTYVELSVNFKSLELKNGEKSEVKIQEKEKEKK